MKKLKSDTMKIINAAIDSVKPENFIRQKVRYDNEILKVGEHVFDMKRYKNVYLVGAGKASAFMAKEFENILLDRITKGCVSVKYGHGTSCRVVKIMEAGHPVVDINSLTATDKILEYIKLADENDLVICLISGGGSALLEKLPDAISLPDLQKVFELLLQTGANIEEFNTIRKHLSKVKGGNLARFIAPATCISIILSDVVGDNLNAIASGPTVPDPGTFLNALEIFKKYNLNDKIPPSVFNYLQKGKAGEAPETPKPGNSIFEKVHNIILGNNLTALAAAKKTAESLGYKSLIISSRIQGEAREVAKFLAAIAQEIYINNIPIKKPACILCGGETTVTVSGSGIGGRNQELALAALLALKNIDMNYLIASIGTDGSDGPTDAAGGMVYPEIWPRVFSLGLNPATFLQNNNSYPFLDKIGGLIKTGPTGTNVMDIILALIPS